MFLMNVDANTYHIPKSSPFLLAFRRQAPFRAQRPISNSRLKETMPIHQLEQAGCSAGSQAWPASHKSETKTENKIADGDIFMSTPFFY
jgi:hypothetical protein